MFRALSTEVKTYAATLASIAQVQAAQVLPNWGAVSGFWLDLSVALSGATASQSSNSIDHVIQRFAVDDVQGESLFDLLGTDIAPLLDALSPTGEHVGAPVVATSAGGAGSAEWFLWVPFTIDAKDMPATLKVTMAPTSSLQNASLVSAGTATATLDVRISIATPDQVPPPSLRIKATNPPVSSGANQLGPYLPGGFQAELIMFTLVGGDAELSLVQMLHQRGIIASGQVLHDFSSLDAQFMRSGHQAGEFICRWPTFVVDSTSYLSVTLTGSVSTTDLRLYTVATVAQQQRTK